MKLCIEKVSSLKHLTYTKASIILEVSLTTLYSFCKRNQIFLQKEQRGGRNFKDLSNQIFGSLTVLGRDGSNGKLATWNCLCSCGNKTIAVGADLRQGKIKTCGCRISIMNRRNWKGFGEIPKSYWSSIIKNAEQRKLHFDITIEYLNSVWIRQNQKCKLSGLGINFNDNSASLDRVDNAKGYIKDNIQWLHKDINKLKTTFGSDKFIELCKHVYIHTSI